MLQWLAAWLLTCSLAAAQPVAGGRSININANDAVYDRASGRLYAVTRPDSSEVPQSVVLIDPVRGVIVQSTPLPVYGMIIQPVPLPIYEQSIVLSEDGRHLYALATGFPSVVVRIDAASMSIESQYTLEMPGCFDSNCRVVQVLPVAGQDRTLIALAMSGNTLGAVAVFDDDRRRPKIVEHAQLEDISLIVQGPEPDLIYGYNGITTAWHLTRMRVSDEGIQREGNAPQISPTGFNRALAVSRRILYSSNGMALDVEKGGYAGQFRDPEVTFATAFAIDEEANRIFFATRNQYGTTYQSFDVRTFLPVARLRVENPDAKNLAMPFAPRRMLLTREGDLVVFDSQQSQMVFLPAAALTPYEPYVLPPMERVTPHVSLLPAPAAFLAADAVNQRLYFTMLGHIAGSGNSVVALDPPSGWTSDPVFAGSDPGPLAVSKTGKYVYVGLQGERVVRRFSVPGLSADMTITPFWIGDFRTFWVGGFRNRAPAITTHILPLPESDESIALIQGALRNQYVVDYDGTTVYDGAVRRPHVVPADFDGNITSAAMSADGTWIYGLQGTMDSFEFSQVRIQADGAKLEKFVRSIGSSFDEKISCDDFLCATTAGTVLDANGPTKLARLPKAGEVIVDRARGTVYVLRSAGTGSELLEYDAWTVQLLRHMALPIRGPFWCFVRWASDQFAVLSEDGVWLIAAAGLA
ncbi:MAG: hypothetical protein IT168_25350 [Bryobacterales bacterium]|nr:hypothetical protein [Bryobacterales bacterium]